MRRGGELSGNQWFPEQLAFRRRKVAGARDKQFNRVSSPIPGGWTSVPRSGIFKPITMTSHRKKSHRPNPFDSFIANQAEVLTRREPGETEKDPDMLSSSLKAAAAARKEKPAKKKADGPSHSPSH